MLARANSNMSQQAPSESSGVTSPNPHQFEPSTVRDIERVMRDLEYMRQANSKFIEESHLLIVKNQFHSAVMYNPPEQYPQEFRQSRPSFEMQVREVKQFTSKVMGNLVETSLTLDRLSQETKKMEKYVVLPNGSLEPEELGSYQPVMTSLRTPTTNLYENMIREQLIEQEKRLAEEKQHPAPPRTFHEKCDSDWNERLHQINRTLNKCIQDAEEIEFR